MEPGSSSAALVAVVQELVDSPRDVIRLQGIAAGYDLKATVAGKLLLALDLPEPKDPPLSERKLEILELVYEGHTYTQIGKRLGVTASTVRTHINKIYDLLGVHDRAQAALLAYREGWIG